MTLIEVMVALAILGLVATGVLALVGQNSRFVVSAQDRMLASILADNIMVERLSTQQILEGGDESEEREFAGQIWSANETITAIEGAGMLRIDIEIRRSGSDQILASASTLKPVRQQ